MPGSVRSGFAEGSKHPPPADVIDADVARALSEDLGSGDVTAALLPDDPDIAYLLCKEAAVVCGRPWFDACHRALDVDVSIDWRVDEGDRVGGGSNHRIGLFDAVMLKENHIRAAGSLPSAIHAARTMYPALPLVVEVETLQQLREALETGCDRILIDDFDATTRREAVRIARGPGFDGSIPLEVSGGVDLQSVRTIAEDGVDFISIGGLTKHVRAIDLSMKLGPPPA